MRLPTFGSFLVLVSLMASPVSAQVHVNIGINLPGPPQWAVVPQLPVYYAPGAPANVFRYNQQCYAFVNGGWYVGPGYHGPWIAVAPQFVPAPLLHVPVRYYHEPPGHWQEWHHDERPHWEHEYGQDWDKHREGWRNQDHEGRAEHRR